jgi:hypothetical protein
MTDRETLIAMFKRADVTTGIPSLFAPVEPDPLRLFVSADSRGAGNKGYPGFCVEFQFDESGALIAVDVGE